jgi:hypothetical protein
LDHLGSKEYHDPLVSGKMEQIPEKSIEILYLWLVKFMPIGSMVLVYLPTKLGDF